MILKINLRKLTQKVCTVTTAARPGYVAPSIIQSHRSVRQNPTAEALTDSQPGTVKQFCNKGRLSKLDSCLVQDRQAACLIEVVYQISDEINIF